MLLLLQYIRYHVQNVWELLIGKLCSICKDLARCHTISMFISMYIRCTAVIIIFFVNNSYISFGYIINNGEFLK